MELDDEDTNSSVLEDWTAERLSRASYKDLGTPQEVESRFLRHLLASSSCQSSLRILLTSTSTTTRDYSLEIDAFDLLQDDPILGHMLLKFPGTLLKLLENAIVAAQKEIQRQILMENEDQGIDSMSATSKPIVKGDKGDSRNGFPPTRVHARLVHLPPTCCKMSLASMQASDVGKIVQCSGTIVRTSPVCMYESCRTYRCAGKTGCGKTFYIHANLEQRHNPLVTPERCKSGQPCKGHNFHIVEGGSVHTDYQEVVIQEAASQLGGSHVPRSLLIKLQHDLVDRCQPGDEVIVVGNLIAQWHQTVMPDVDCPVGMSLEAHSIRVVQDKSSSAWSNVPATGAPSSDAASLRTELDDDKYRQEFVAYWEHPKHLSIPIAARDQICKAVCPKLYGLAVVKLALLMTLIGGVCQEDYDRHTRKENNHGRKSVANLGQMAIANNDEPEPFQVTQNERAVAPSTFYGGEERRQSKHFKSNEKGVQTRRRGQSHLLLVGDPGTGKSQFLRFAAAICPRSVLTTGIGTTSAGLTCAAVRDGNGKEFSLEAGALVLADQGVCCIDEFGCIQESDKTTIHEAMEQQTLSVAKAGIVCKLNCRATIIAVMNPKDCVYDNQASLSRNTGLGTPLLSRFDLIFKMVDSSNAERDSNVTTYLLNRAIQGAGFECITPENDELKGAPWSMEKLRAYISLVREKFQPTMSDDAALILERHYEKARSVQSTTIPVTVRFLESLIRLAQAHARLMFRNVVTLDDAVAVIRVMECTAFAYGGFDGNVDDAENVLYCDPVSIDFSVQPDVDFLCFKAQILQRYNLGDRLTPDQRRLVDEALGNNGSGVGSHEWNAMESDRDRDVARAGGPYGIHHDEQYTNRQGLKRRKFQ